MHVNQAHDTVSHPCIDNIRFPFLHHTCFISTPLKLTTIARYPSKHGRLYSRSTADWGDSDHVQRFDHDDAHSTTWGEFSRDGYAKDNVEIEPRRYHARRGGDGGRRGYLREDQRQHSANGRARLRGGSESTREWRQNQERRPKDERHGWSEHSRRGDHGRTGRGRRGRPESHSVKRQNVLAGKIRDLGREGDWKGILRELEEGPKNIIICTIAAKALGQLKKWREATKVLRDAESGEGGEPDAFLYASVIDACGKAGRPVEAVALLSEMISRGIKPDQVCYGAAIAALSEVAASYKHRVHWGRIAEDESPGARDSAVLGRVNEGGVEEALAEEENGEGVADRSDQVDVREEADAGGVADEERSGNGHVDVRDGVASVGEVEASATTSAAESPSLPHEKAVSLIEEMRRKDPRPNKQCFGSAITACARARDPRKALRVLAAMQEDGVPPNDIVLNAAVDACGKGDAPDQALRLLRAMEANFGVRPNTITYNCVISGLSRAGRPREARALLKEMAAKGLEPDHFSYSAAMQGFAAAGDASNSAALSEEIKSRGVGMDIVSYGTAVNACAKAGDVAGALKLMKDMEKAGLEANVVVYNSALDACAKSGKAKDADKIIKIMTEAGIYPNSLSYTGAIAACAKAGDGAKALEWLRVMSRKGIKPETICYNHAITACGRSGKPDDVVRLLTEMHGENIPRNRISYSSAMFALGKAGRLDEVLELLAKMHDDGVEADEVTYHIAIDAASIARNLPVAMDLFKDMHARGLPVSQRRVSYIRDRIAGREAGSKEASVDSDGRTERGGNRGSPNATPSSVRRMSDPDVLRMLGPMKDDRGDFRVGEDTEGGSTRGAVTGGDDGGVDVDSNREKLPVVDHTELEYSAALHAELEEADGEVEVLHHLRSEADDPVDLPVAMMADSTTAKEDDLLTPAAEDLIVTLSADEMPRAPSATFGSREAVTQSPSVVDVPTMNGGFGRVNGDGGTTSRDDDGDISEYGVGSSDPGEIAGGDGEFGSLGDVVVVEELRERALLLQKVKNMKVVDLKEELRQRGLRLSGKKADMVARLEKALQETC